MNFERLKSKLKTSASKAADAARNFKGFDDMAANDEYIHTDGLNVKRKNNASSSVELTVSTGAEGVQKVNVSLTEPDALRRPRPPQQSLKTRHSHQSDGEGQELELGSRHSEEDLHMTDDEDDPILNRMRTTGKQRRGKKKNTNRFMEDLEQRISTPRDEEEGQSDGGDPENSPLLSPEQSPPPPRGWMAVWPLRSRTSNTPDQPQHKPIAPLAKQKSKRILTNPQEEGESQEQFEVKASTGVLDAADMRELEQLRQPSALARAWNFYQDHPRECFIGFTLLLGAFAYFHSRRETVEDDVTRR